MLSQMIRKSIETRDWLASHEPRHVRGAVRRVVEEISIIDKHVGRLFEEGQKKEISGVCKHLNRIQHFFCSEGLHMTACIIGTISNKMAVHALEPNVLLLKTHFWYIWSSNL